MPVTFTDTEKTAWSVHVDVGALKSCRDALGIMVTDILDPNSDLFKDIAVRGNPITLVDILWVLCREQAMRRDVTEDQFARNLGGEALEGAAKALVEATLNFSQPAGAKAAMALFEKTRQINIANLATLQEAIDLGVIEERYYQDHPEVAEMRRLVEKARLTCGRKSSNSAESSASDPPDSS